MDDQTLLFDEEANALVAQHGEKRLRSNLWQKVKDLLRDVASKISGQPIKTALLETKLNVLRV
jgi:hypothetical protein